MYGGWKSPEHHCTIWEPPLMMPSKYQDVLRKVLWKFLHHLPCSLPFHILLFDITSGIQKKKIYNVSSINVCVLGDFNGKLIYTYTTCTAFCSTYLPWSVGIHFTDSSSHWCYFGCPWLCNISVKQKHKDVI